MSDEKFSGKFYEKLHKHAKNTIKQDPYMLASQARSIAGGSICATETAIAGVFLTSVNAATGGSTSAIHAGLFAMNICVVIALREAPSAIAGIYYQLALKNTRTESSNEQQSLSDKIVKRYTSLRKKVFSLPSENSLRDLAILSMTQDQFENLKKQMNQVAGDSTSCFFSLFSSNNSNTSLNNDISQFKSLNIDTFKKKYIREVIIKRNGRLSQIAQGALKEQKQQQQTLAVG